jgi:hypothetical protein
VQSRDAYLQAETSPAARWSILRWPVCALPALSSKAAIAYLSNGDDSGSARYSAA